MWTTYDRGNLHCHFFCWGLQHGFFFFNNLKLDTVYSWKSEVVAIEGRDIPATGLEVSWAWRGGRAWHGSTGKGCNRHRGRIVCNVELRGRTSRNVITGSTETFTEQNRLWCRNDLCQQTLGKNKWAKVANWTQTDVFPEHSKTTTGHCFKCLFQGSGNVILLHFCPD